MKSSKGISLLEILIVLPLICGLFFCASQVIDFYQNKHTGMVYDELKMAVRFARMQALEKGVPFALNPLTEQNWSSGIRLFVDNKNHQYSAKDDLLYQWQWGFKDVQVEWKGFRSEYYLIFSPLIRQASSNGTFIVKNTRGIEKKIVINRLGSFQ